MRHKVLFYAGVGLLAAGLLAIAIVVMAQPRPRPGDRPLRPVATQAKYQLEIRLQGGMTVEKLAETMPKSLPYYKASVDMGRSKTVASRLAGFLKVNGDMKAAEKGLQTTGEGEAEVEVFEASGAVFGADMERLWAKLPEQATRGLTPETAKAQAVEFLQQMGVDMGQEYTAEARQDVVTITERGGRPRRIPGPFQVSVRPRLNGYPTVGGGEKAKVFYDDDGKIAGCLVVRRALSPDKTGELLDVREAVKKLAEGGALDNLTLTRPDRIVINEISVAYYGRAAVEEQDFVQPVYVFRGTASGGGRQEAWRTPYMQYIAALTSPPESIYMPPDTDDGEEKVEDDLSAEGPEDDS